ncbi:hypothetical protein SAY86_023097 [Trapa natans]|uniref:RING-type E3 ubiquitin transferase n=1 Tax=Trapa natans TaxID=22666 RepID=A0AAN7R7K4_TRANT|nr:hypothetical protein SAY86_023097 [Trapa natans]
MSFHRFILQGKISTCDEEYDDDDMILFCVNYENTTKIVVMDDDEDVYLESTNENSIDETATRYLYKSQLINFQRGRVESVFTSMAEDLVPDDWAEETVEQLVEAAYTVGKKLRYSSNDDDEPLRVDIKIDTQKVVEPDEDSDSSIVDYFQEIHVNYRMDPNAKVYRRTGLASCSTVSFDEVEDESCSICTEDYESGDNIVSIDCSHQFHSGCILKWVRRNSNCPLCRSDVPCENEMVVVHDPVIHYLSDDDEDED